MIRVSHNNTLNWHEGNVALKKNDSWTKIFGKHMYQMFNILTNTLRKLAYVEIFQFNL